MEIYLISGLLIFLGISLFLIRKQFLLNEVLLEETIRHENLVKNIDTIVEQIGLQLDRIDTKGSFKSDDEIGWFFKDVQNLYEILKDYKNFE